MPVEVILPKVDMDMSHGTLATWHAAEGQLVQQGAPLFDIETDKAAMEVESPATGYLRRITAQAGAKVAVGTTIALLYAEGETMEPLSAALSAAPSAPISESTHLQPTEVILPKVDMDMTHGTLAVWHVADGEMVQQGAPLFDIETDKAAMEVEAPATGRLHHITAKPGDRVPVGSTLAWIYPEGLAAGQAPQKTSAPEVATPPAVSSIVAQPINIATGLGARATPAARMAARDNGISLNDIQGTGPLGRVQKADVIGQRAEQDRPADAQALADWNREPGPLHISRRHGTGKPIILLHGFTADSQSWAPLEKALGVQSPLLRLDLPGHGKSPKRQINSFADLARMVVEAFDDATRDIADVHLVGHSLGAALALALADIRPRRIASLTLIAPAGLGPEIDAAALNGIVRASRVESLAPWLRRLTATPQGISDDYARAAMRARGDGQLRACQSEMAQALFPDGVQSFDLRAALNRADYPTQIVWGRNDLILPHRQGVQADGEFALHLLTEAGHIPQIECPDRVARIINRMIRSVDSSG